MLKVTASLSIALVSLVGLVATFIALFLVSIPRPTDIRECLVTKMYQVSLCPKDKTYVPLRNISVHARNAVVASEDAGFYGHKGIDFHEMRESFETNLERGRWARGGSTLTQQLAKNVYLSSEKSLLRKVKEAIIALQLEKILSKDEILEKYLNVVEFGPKIYGIHAASWYYFKKAPSELTPAESSFLAFLLPSPKKYSVSFQKKQLSKFALSQTRQILTRLQKFKKLSDADYQAAVAQLDSLFADPASSPELNTPFDGAEESPEEEATLESGPQSFDL